MAKSTYISENLTQLQINFMLMLDDHELDIFSLADLKKIADPQFEDVNEIVENLVDKKLLSRIERAKYCRANFRDEKAIGCFLVADGTIAYWSALNIYGLTEQFPNTIFIQTTHIKQGKTVFGILYKFIKIAHHKRTGITREGQGNFSYHITDIEKTITDCFDLPQYCGGYAELIRAFSQAKLSSEKMITYCQAIDNIAVIKRMGYLAELINKKGLKNFIRFAKEQVNQAINPFDPQGIEKGEFIADWRLRLNISKEEILDITCIQKG